MKVPNTIPSLVRTGPELSERALVDNLPVAPTLWPQMPHSMLESLPPSVLGATIYSSAAWADIAFPRAVSDYACYGGSLASALYTSSMRSSALAPWPSNDLYTFGLTTPIDPGKALLQQQLQIAYKLESYRELKQDLEDEIAYLKYEFLYDESMEEVHSQQEKLAIVNGVIEQLHLLQRDPADIERYTTYSAAELRLSDYADVYTLHFRRALRSLGTWRAEQEEPEPFALPAPLLAIFQRGRLLRLFFKPRVRDRRRLFRSLVRTLFKQLDDQSGVDEFLAPNHSVPARIYSSTKIWFNHDKFRNHCSASAAAASPSTH